LGAEPYRAGAPRRRGAGAAGRGRMRDRSARELPGPHTLQTRRHPYLL